MGKMRSPNYPACSLSEAVRMVRKLWDKEKNTVVSPDVAATALGYKSLSGPVRTYIAALKQYGLLSRDKHGVRVSQQALEIIHGADEDERTRALQQAALKPEIFRQLSQTHLAASEDALRSYLITRLGFSEIGAKKLVDSFRDTVAFAKLGEQGYSPSEQSSGSEATMMGSTASGPDNRHATGAKVLRSFSWPLSTETTAKLEIIGGEELTSAHIDALTQYLEVAKKLLKPSQS